MIWKLVLGIKKGMGIKGKEPKGGEYGNFIFNFMVNLSITKGGKFTKERGGYLPWNFANFWYLKL